MYFLPKCRVPQRWAILDRFTSLSWISIISSKLHGNFLIILYFEKNQHIDMTSISFSVDADDITGSFSQRKYPIKL